MENWCPGSPLWVRWAAKALHMHHLSLEGKHVQYAGFWMRVAAALIDTVLILMLTTPLLYAIYGEQYFHRGLTPSGSWDFLISWGLPAVAIITFWIYRAATPGKIMLHLKIVDAQTGAHPTKRQFFIRFLTHHISSLALAAGLVWVAFDKRKQGWHDKFANTVVIKDVG